jgi:hypothetical protein
MEMVRQQAICEGIRDRVDMSRIKLQEILVILSLKEEIFAVVPAIINMIEKTWL